MCSHYSAKPGCGVIPYKVITTAKSIPMQFPSAMPFGRLPPWANFLLLTACLILMGYLEGGSILPAACL